MTALVKHQGVVLTDLDSMQRFAKVAIAAGIVGKAQRPEEAIGKAVMAIQAGAELGVPPLASLANIHIVHGRPGYSAALVASKIQSSGKYDYKIIEHDEKKCVIEFFKNGTTVGLSEFTLENAKQAKLAGDNWSKYPRNMLWARAMTNGCRWFCSEVTHGKVYTPEELGESDAVESLPAPIDEPPEPVTVVPCDPETGEVTLEVVEQPEVDSTTPTDKQIARLKSLASDERLKARWRKRVAEHLIADDLDRKTANNIILLAKQQIENETGQRYAPPS